MPFIKTKKLILPIIVLSQIAATTKIYAEEKAEGGEEEAKPAASAEGSSNSDREWAKRQTKLNVLETKMKDLTKELEHLIHIKNTGGAAVDEKGKPIDVLETIAGSYKKLKQTVEEYNTEKSELKYRFPEEGARIERRYVPLRVQSLEQIEKNSGLDGELTRTKMKIDKKYATFVGDTLAKPPPRAPAAESTLKDKVKEAHKDEGRLKLSQ